MKKIMHKKVGVVGIGLDVLRSRYGVRALAASGNNSGNMLFTSAVYSQIKGAEHIGFDFSPEHVGERFDSIVIPAANWINSRQDWGALADRLEASGLPVTVVGLGGQISIEDIGQIPEGTKRFLSVCGERGTAIGVRGDYTAEIISALGIKNVKALGCPSIFYHGGIPVIRDLPLTRKFRLGVGPTRYDLAPASFEASGQRQIYQYAIRNASSIYYQSEQFEIEVLDRSVDKASLNRGADYYSISSADELENLILQKGKFHTSLPQWISDVKKDDFYIGTRIHGVIAAALAGTPGLLITHDHRTKELAEFMCVPSVPLEKFDVSMLDNPEDLFTLIDLNKFSRRSKRNIVYLKEFYRDNKLQANF